jgi:hypothetical protein
MGYVVIPRIEKTDLRRKQDFCLSRFLDQDKHATSRAGRPAVSRSARRRRKQVAGRQAAVRPPFLGDAEDRLLAAEVVEPRRSHRNRTPGRPTARQHSQKLKWRLTASTGTGYLNDDDRQTGGQLAQPSIGLARAAGTNSLAGPRSKDGHGLGLHHGAQAQDPA